MTATRKTRHPRAKPAKMWPFSAKIGVCEDLVGHRGYYLAWVPDGIEGLALGELQELTCTQPLMNTDFGALLKAQPEAIENRIVEEAARVIHAATGVPSDRVLHWESYSKARLALLEIRKTASVYLFRAQAGRPLEDWEQKALAAGWRPPHA